MENKLFYKDTPEGMRLTYRDLLDDLNSRKYFYPYCRVQSYYEIFQNIIFSLLLDREIVLLDVDFSDEEVTNLIGDISLIEATKVIPDLDEEITFGKLIRIFQTGLPDWKITLFTSGTTGLPKKVSHTFASLTRFVKTAEFHKDDVWGFAYNPTHMAGLQVFFQSLMNMNSIIRLFGLSRDEILELIERDRITHISATPTFYRLLMPADRVLESVSRITSGGERFDERTLNHLKRMFPGAKITNVYASTEAGTLFAASGDVFTIKDGMQERIKVVGDELFLHKSLLGQSERIVLQDDWYPTGDLIEILSKDPFVFKFISRRNEMINVGGYKVNPGEVEEAIRQCPGVGDVCVFAKKNSILGNIVCCEVVKKDSELTEKTIRKFLCDKLQEFKIPRMIKFVEQISTTRTGKISRNK